jgi:glycosyltransferase involved in cell wall biosynthesis
MTLAPGTTPLHGPLRLSVIVCAWNEAPNIAACLHSVLAQTRPPDEVILVDNASSDGTAAIAAGIPGVRVVAEPRKGLTRAREAGRRAATGDVLAWLDADCRAPLQWLERVEARFGSPRVVAVSGPLRYYDWDWFGRGLMRAYDLTVAPLTHVAVRDVARCGAILYGGNFAVRAATLARIGGFDTSIEFHGEDTNLGRRLQGEGRVELVSACWMYTSARRFRAMGRFAVLRLYARNFWHEVLWHVPADTRHLDVRS